MRLCGRVWTVLGLIGWLLVGCASGPNAADRQAAGQDLPGFDADYPPAMHELSFNSGGSKLNGLLYVANGAGPHPLVILLHGYPGNERNLDLAQALRRAGNNVLYFNYRGTWGSGGEFLPSRALEDGARAVALARDAEWAERYRVDPSRVALVGHSFGGFVGAINTAADPSVSCLAFLAGANIGALGTRALADESFRQGFEQAMGASIDSEGGPVRGDAGQLIREIMNRAAEFDVNKRALALSAHPLLLVAGSRDAVLPIAEHHQPLVEALRAVGAASMTVQVYDDDHAFSAHRVELAALLGDWIQNQCWVPPAAQE
ncbi:MAG: alpha/beta fold hydrolase [Xanthomonadales bacterium]|nr:alpha/beta fold hydrolase [Xanthomonadales bacterium]